MHTRYCVNGVQGEIGCEGALAERAECNSQVSHVPLISSKVVFIKVLILISRYFFAILKKFLLVVERKAN